MTTPTQSLSRSTSRSSRHGETSRSRPRLEKRDSSPMRTLATLGLLAGQAGIGAAAPLRTAQADGLHLQAPQAHSVASSRMLEDSAAAMQIAKRGGEDGVDWSKVDYSGVDWSKVDFSAPGTPQAGPSASSPAPSAYAPPAESPRPSSPAPAPLQMPAAQKPLGNAGVSVFGDKDLFAGVAEKDNAIAIVWRGKYDATFNIYANSGPYQPGLGAAFKTLSIKAGSRALVPLPQGFSGRVQLMSGEGKADDDATWAEVAFNQWQGLTFFDVSLIRGTNAGLSMRASDGSSKAEIPADILDRAPDSIKVKDSGGRMVIKDTEGYDGGLNQDAIDWLHGEVKLTDAYARNFEDAATHSTKDNHLVFEFSV